MDNQPRAKDSGYYHCHLTWIDTNMQAALSCWVLAQMAQLLDEPALAERLNDERAFLHREINAQMWRDDTGFYHDLDPSGSPTLLKSIGAYWGFLDKDLVPPEREEPFLRHLRDQKAFNRPHRVPSMAADCDGYDPETGDYWRGGVWSPTNYMVLKGLRRASQHRLAHQIAVNHLKSVATVFQHTDTFWENYAPEDARQGEPAKADFVGWTGLSAISILIEDVIGISVDWPLRRVSWDRRLGHTEPYGLRNFPLGSDGRLDLVGDSSAIEVVTDTPFTLEVRDGDASIQTAVAVGTSTISL
jgi:glycogen debranching enzyme